MEAKTDIKLPEVEPTILAEPFQDSLTKITQSLQNSKLEEEHSITFVNTLEGVAKLLEGLADLPTEPPSLYIDLEGVNLSRHGTISILQIFVSPKNHTFLIDIHTLKAETFSHTSSNGSTLRSVLQSPSIPKVFFDVRNDSDALFSHYEIKLSGVHDLQLMELAQRQSSRRLVNGLGRCIEQHSSMTQTEKSDWKAAKNLGRKLFAPEHGGSYEVFNIRPLPEEIVQYCAQDVRFLPKLWHKYHQGMTQTWRVKVEAEVQNRIQLSQSLYYNGKGRHMALAPKGWL